MLVAVVIQVRLQGVVDRSEAGLNSDTPSFYWPRRLLGPTGKLLIAPLQFMNDSSTGLR